MLQNPSQFDVIASLAKQALSDPRVHKRYYNGLMVFDKVPVEEMGAINGLVTIADSDNVYQLVALWPVMGEVIINKESIMPHADEIYQTNIAWWSQPDGVPIIVYKNPICNRIEWIARPPFEPLIGWQQIIQLLIDSLDQSILDIYLKRYTLVFTVIHPELTVFPTNDRPHLVLMSAMDKARCEPRNWREVLFIAKQLNIHTPYADPTLSERLDSTYSWCQNESGRVQQIEINGLVKHLGFYANPYHQQPFPRSYRDVEIIEEAMCFDNLEFFRAHLQQINTPPNLVNNAVIWWLTYKAWYAYVLKQANIVLLNFMLRETGQPMTQPESEQHFKALETCVVEDRFNTLVQHLKRHYWDLAEQPNAIDRLMTALSEEVIF